MTYFVETSRLGLKLMDGNDFDAVASMLRDKDVMYAWEKTFSDEEIYGWIERRARGYRENGFDYFLAIDLQKNEAVGQIGLLKENLGGETVFGLGWILKKDCWGKGYALEGAHALMDYAFRLLELPELIADIRPKNTASIRVAKNLGMHEAETVVKMVDGKKMPHTVYRIKNPYRLYCEFKKPLPNTSYPTNVKNELVQMEIEDLTLRETLASRGKSRDRYHPLMEGVHIKNSLRLEEIIATYGYPTIRAAGKDASDSAWLIIQHAIGRPSFMRAALQFFGTLNAFEIEPSSFAYLSDRVAYYERRPQTYATQYCYGLDGVFAPWWTENENAVAVRRSAACLPPSEEVYERMLKEGAAKTIEILDSFQIRVAEERWLLSTGWCDMSALEFCHNTYNN